MDNSFDGCLNSDRVLQSYTHVIRPVISLKQSVYVSSGTGTLSDPYIVTSG